METFQFCLFIMLLVVAVVLVCAFLAMIVDDIIFECKMYDKLK